MIQLLFDNIILFFYLRLLILGLSAIGRPYPLWIIFDPNLGSDQMMKNGSTEKASIFTRFTLVRPDTTEVLCALSLVRCVSRTITSQNKLGWEQTAVISSRTPVTTVTLAVHECFCAHQVRSASCVFQHFNCYVTGARLKITAVCPSLANQMKYQI